MTVRIIDMVMNITKTSPVSNFWHMIAPVCQNLLIIVGICFVYKHIPFLQYYSAYVFQEVLDTNVLNDNYYSARVYLWWILCSEILWTIASMVSTGNLWLHLTARTDFEKSYGGSSQTNQYNISIWCTLWWNKFLQIFQHFQNNMRYLQDSITVLVKRVRYFAFSYSLTPAMF